MGFDQAATATSYFLHASTVIAVPVTSTRRTSDVLARVLVELDRPLATVILPIAVIGRTLVLATSTGQTSVVPAHARGLEQAVTATQLPVPVTRTVGAATSTERTSDLPVRVITALRYTTPTVIRLLVLSTRTVLLATITTNTLVLPVRVLGIYMPTTATTLVAQVTRILGPATSTKRTSEVTARVLVGGDHPMATAILIPVLVTHIVELATITESTSAATAPAVDRSRPMDIVITTDI